MRQGLQRAKGGNRQSLPYLVFLLSMAATLCAWAWAGLVVGNKDQERFTYATEEAEHAIRDRIGDQVDLLRATAATFNLQGRWTRSQFHSYVNSLHLGTFFKGSQGIGFIQRIQPSEVDQVEKRLKLEGEVDFAIHPRSTKEPMYPVIYIEPRTSLNNPSVGFDTYTDPIRRLALLSARDSGQPTVSGLVSVPSQSGSRSVRGFLMYCPVYAGGAIPDTAADRAQKLIGFIYTRFRGGELFRDVLEGEARRDLSIEIFDAESGKTPVRFYQSARTAGDTRAKIVFDGYIPVHGRQWLVRYHSSRAFEQQSAYWLVRWIPISGLLISAVLAAVSFSQVKAYDQLHSKARELERSESNQRLLATIGAQLVDLGSGEENLRAVAQRIAESFGDFCAILFTVSGRSLIVRCKSNSSDSLNPAGVFEDNAVVGWLTMHPTPVRFDLSKGPDAHLYEMQNAGIGTLAVLPILDRQLAIGSLVVGRQSNAFSDDDMAILVQISSRIGAAITNDRLVDERESELEERRKAEERANRLNENLEQIVEERTTELRATNKELEAFCYSVSHDLRAPLRSVDGFSKSLVEDYYDKLDDQARDYLTRLRNASHRMDELISALLNLSRITRLEIVRQPIDMSSLAKLALEDVLDGQDPTHFQVIIRPGMKADADPKLVRVLLDNLLRNAVKFSSPKEVAIIEIGIHKNAFFVKDNGVGFNPAYSDKLFVAFERLHSHHEFPGSGIGLATVQRIVQRHGGIVWAESTEGQGATFYFTLR